MQSTTSTQKEDPMRPSVGHLQNIFNVLCPLGVRSIGVHGVLACILAAMRTSVTSETTWHCKQAVISAARAPLPNPSLKTTP